VSRPLLFAEVPCFYAAVEIARDPSLAGRPLLVGGDPRKRGLVQAASPEALAAGVVLEMPVAEALRHCPRAKVLRTDMARYRDVSRQLFACLRRSVERIEPFGLGAAYAELGARAEPEEELARALCAAVRAELSLPLRVGIAAGKFVARLAAEEAGAEGVRRIPPGTERQFLGPLPATRLEGVGRKTAALLAELGAHTIGQVAELGRERLEEALGAHGLRVHALACAEDDLRVRGGRHPQTVSREATIREESVDRVALREHLQGLARELEAELARLALRASRITLKLRYADAATQTRSQVLATPASGAAPVLDAALRLLGRTQAGSRPLRSLGIQLSRLAPAAEADRQLDLFPPER
jgi:nucleotidyltransferase/DNA polymerase involved in DNA repair